MQTENQETPYFTGRHCSQVIQHSFHSGTSALSDATNPKPCVRRRSPPATAHSSPALQTQGCVCIAEETWNRSSSSCQGAQQERAGHQQGPEHVPRTVPGMRGTVKKPKKKKPSEPSAPPALRKVLSVLKLLIPNFLFTSCPIYHALCLAKSKGCQMS